MGKRGSKAAEPFLAAVLGHPIHHSLSPLIFEQMARARYRPGVYRRIDVPPQELAAFFHALSRRGLFIGWNVTIPHKEAMVNLVDTLSPAARAVGAVNVVHFTDEKAMGHNTDIFGIRQTLRERKCRVAGRRAWILGAGGAARAVAYALGEERAAEVWVANRTPARAQKLCRDFRKLFPRTLFQVATAASLRAEDALALVANATPGGRPVLPAGVRSDTLAFDLVYTERLTSFLQEAARRRARVINGLDMLIWQALATWDIWFGRASGTPELKRRIRRILEKRE